MAFFKKRQKPAPDAETETVVVDDAAAQPVDDAPAAAHAPIPAPTAAPGESVTPAPDAAASAPHPAAESRGPQALSTDELFAAVRVRLLPASSSAELGLAYARQVAPDLVAVLCVDYPDHIEYLTNEIVAANDATALFNAGYRSIMAEKFDVADEFSPGIWALVGDSHFTASKAMGLGQLIGSVLPAAPNGVLFAVPHRHMIFAHMVNAENTVQAVTTISGLAAQYAAEENVGGPISDSTYFYNDGVIDLVSYRTADGGVQVLGSSRFGEKLGALLGG